MPGGLALRYKEGARRQIIYWDSTFDPDITEGKLGAKSPTLSQETSQPMEREDWWQWANISKIVDEWRTNHMQNTLSDTEATNKATLTTATMLTHNETRQTLPWYLWEKARLATSTFDSIISLLIAGGKEMKTRNHIKFTIGNTKLPEIQITMQTLNESWKAYQSRVAPLEIEIPVVPL